MFTETSNGENAIILVTMVRCDRRYCVKTSQLMIGYKNISLSRYFENARLHDRFIVRFWSCDFFAQ